MPNLKSAKKKLRQDRKRSVHNLFYKNQYQKAWQDFIRKPSKKALQKTISLIDKATKVKVLHRNKASRFKSHINKTKLRKNG
jgi:small subunit ribosomal protein S20